MAKIKIEVQHVGGEIDEGYSLDTCNRELPREHASVRDHILDGLAKYKVVTLAKKDETTIIPATDIMRIKIQSIEDEKPAKIEVKQA